MVASCCKKETLQENGQIIFDFKACCDCINIKKTTGLVCILLYAKKKHFRHTPIYYVFSLVD